MARSGASSALRASGQRVHIPEEISARIVASRRSYFISRSEAGEDTFIDDEAEFEIEPVIEKSSKRHRRNLAQAITISLLSACRHAPERSSNSSFFGSVTLRGSDRSAVAYLPAETFWHLPSMLLAGCNVVEFSFTRLRRGFAHLLSLQLTDQPSGVSD